MFRRVAPLFVFVVALVAVPSAFAAFPGPYAVQGGSGVSSPDGSLSFVARAAGDNTVLAATRTSDGSTANAQSLPGKFGVVTLTPNGVTGGMFHDGSAVVLQSLGIEPTTRFVVVDTNDLAVRNTIRLKGTFGLDAISPDGTRLYLIQHTSAQDIQHYIVRAYDLSKHRLLPGRIADKTQKSWIMQGWAVDRAATADGRWVYTLYANPGGYPFIHALDTVRGVAHCIGLPWKETDQAAVYNFTVALAGTSLAVRWQDGRTWRLVNTGNWRVSTA